MGSRAGTDKDLIDILESGVRITSVGPFRSQVCAAEWNVRAVRSALGRTMPSPSCSSPGRILPFTLLFIFLTFTLRFQWIWVLFEINTSHWSHGTIKHREENEQVPEELRIGRASQPIEPLSFRIKLHRDALSDLHFRERVSFRGMRRV